MNGSKKIDVNFSSLVGLKAELLRKRTQAQDAKSKLEESKSSLPRPKVKKNHSRPKHDSKTKKSVEIEDVEELKKSKHMLEAKSKLYDRLKQTHGDRDKMFLVDFENKSDHSESESPVESDFDDRNSDPEDDWVDYEDCFGRTRKCLRKDLPKMKEKDNLIKNQMSKNPQDDQADKSPPPPTFVPPPREPEIEMLRRKWADQMEKLANKSEIHYQDILFDEARTHGVGYYAFSQDEETRAKQQADLAKLRKETEQRQKELKEMKDLKNKMEENRLKAARIRLRIRAGLPAELTDEEKAKESEPFTTENIVIKPQEPAEQNPPTETAQEDKNDLAVIEDKIKAFGELLGKRPHWRELSQEEWVDKRRKDRHSEFAPVYNNFKSGGLLVAAKNHQVLNRDNEENDPLRIPGDGPEPTDLWDSTLLNTSPSESKEPTLTASAAPEPDFSVPPPGMGGIVIPPPDVLFSVPPPPFNSSIPPPTITGNLPAYPPTDIPPFNQPFCGVEDGKTGGESDSDDSDIIGPMPPTICNDKAVSDSISLNVDKISAGLKYLREKFDNSDVNLNK